MLVRGSRGVARIPLISCTPVCQWTRLQEVNELELFDKRCVEVVNILPRSHWYYFSTYGLAEWEHHFYHKSYRRPGIVPKRDTFRFQSNHNKKVINQWNGDYKTDWVRKSQSPLLHFIHLSTLWYRRPIILTITIKCYDFGSLWWHLEWPG